MLKTMITTIVALCLSVSVPEVLATSPGVGVQAGTTGDRSQYTREIHDQCQNIRVLPLRSLQNIPPISGRPDDILALEDSGINVTDIQPRPPPPARLVASCGSPNRRRSTELRLDNCLGWDAAGERLIAQQNGYGIQRGRCWGCKYFPVSREKFRVVCFCDNVTQGLTTVIPGIDRMAAGKAFAEDGVWRLVNGQLQC
ncbi:hypothetical protein ABOM_004950 [Aspergillus bombycis]|uniref:Cyanovirin-N domain-containing protein n=1 Tax=Aspergillus bombycis TaxID=109264 RepID=A0A1F8A366_9EURO|nr:hypothetical protein ABOM_004950 [Aspergillus bombycis]OGM46166.1 hypothetical protein ABOM_004950 [Aspergillus bombycis]